MKGSVFDAFHSFYAQVFMFKICTLITRSSSVVFKIPGKKTKHPDYFGIPPGGIELFQGRIHPLHDKTNEFIVNAIT